MIKILRTSRALEMAALVGIDPGSDGLAAAQRWACRSPPKASTGWSDARLRRDRDRVRRDVRRLPRAPRCGAAQPFQADHRPHACRDWPILVPAVNLHELADQPNVNLVTCGGQATIPIVAAISRVGRHPMPRLSPALRAGRPDPAHARTSTSSRDDRARSRASEAPAGAKPIIVLNPAEPPLIMRNTVFCLVEDGDPAAIEQSVEQMAGRRARLRAGLSA